MSTTVSICPRFPVQGRCHAHAHLEPRNQAAVHIPPSPTNKWPDQAHEQDNQAVHLCVCGSSPSGLGSEPTFCNPCIQHIRASIDPDHPFPHAIRSRSSTATRPQSVLVNPQHTDTTELWLSLSPTNEWPDQAHEQDDQADHLCLCGSSPSGLGS